MSFLYKWNVQIRSLHEKQQDQVKAILVASVPKLQRLSLEHKKLLFTSTVIIIFLVFPSSTFSPILLFSRRNYISHAIRFSRTESNISYPIILRTQMRERAHCELLDYGHYGRDTGALNALPLQSNPICSTD